MAEGGGIQQEIADLERQLNQKREQFLGQKNAGEISEMPEEKEILHEIVRERMGENQPFGQQPPSQALPNQTPPVSAVTLPVQLTEEMKATIQNLVNMAFNDSLEKAIQKVRATNNAALIDAFHDVLVDELFEYLVERGKLKKI